MSTAVTAQLGAGMTVARTSAVFSQPVLPVQRTRAVNVVVATSGSVNVGLGSNGRTIIAPCSHWYIVVPAQPPTTEGEASSVTIDPGATGSRRTAPAATKHEPHGARNWTGTLEVVV